MARFYWTEEMHELLLRLWGKKKTGEAIALYFSKKYKRKFTRAAILGCISRLGAQRSKVETEPHNAALTRNRNVKHNRLVITRPSKARIKKIDLRVQPLGRPNMPDRIAEATVKRCTYIHGDAKGRDFCANAVAFNDRSTSGAYSWCHEHLAIVYQPKRGMSIKQFENLSTPLLHAKGRGR